MSLRIAIFDDNKNIRDSIRLLLNTVPDFEVVGHIFSWAGLSTGCKRLQT
jgi:DNA-binding NarL/FixJ family response regulator